MLSRPLAPQGQEAAAFTDVRPGGVAEPAIRPGAVRSPKTTAAPRGRTASVADQPAGELPAAATTEAGSAAASTEDIAAVPAETGHAAGCPRGRRGGGHPAPGAPVSRPPSAGAGALRRRGVRRDRAGGRSGRADPDRLRRGGGAGR